MVTRPTDEGPGGATAAGTSSASRHERARWVFGVMRAPHPCGGPLPDDVDTVRENGLVALTREVSLADFPQDVAGLDSADDLERLERYARQHDHVLNTAVRAGAVLPLRFATVVSDHADVRTLLRRHAEVFAAWLDDLAGRAEYTVKAWLDDAALTGESVPDGEQPERPGTAYLRRRQAQRVREDEARRRRHALVEELHDRLAALAEEATTVPTRPETPSPRPSHHGAYLATEHQREALAAEVEALGREHHRRGVTLRLAGPWPAHHFVPDSWEAGASG